MHKNRLFLFYIILLFTISCQTGFETDSPKKIDGELAGGETTVFLSTSQAFGTPAPNLGSENLQKHMDGDLSFETTFVSNPSPKNGGLGPVFNNNSCIACHPSDARASVPNNINGMSGFFLRVSIPGTGVHGGPNPVPGFGTQLQHQALYGYKPEARLERQYEESSATLADGTIVNLQKPVFTIVQPYTDLPSNLQISPRIGMPVFGLGLLEAIPENAILAQADPDDLDGNGISGKANYVWDPVSQSIQLGRFGWKAGASSILAQSAGAYSEDMGLTTYIHPFESSFGQTNSDTNSVSPEVSRQELDRVTFYCQTLGVPAGRNFEDQQVIKGRQIFEKIDCMACHTSSYTTGMFEGIPEISHQTIYPYTDMLLHDMGDELADNRSEFLANGNEWKTRPLWGIGLTQITSGHTSFLHDGRARNITEAILWHGGEAQNSRDKFIQLSSEDRDALLQFLNAL